MPTQKFSTLRTDIRNELRYLDYLVQQELHEFQRERSDPPTRTEVRAAGSIAHDFYSAVERIFKRIAVEVDGTVAEGAAWHRRLLGQMAATIPGVRPAVIDQELEDELHEYLRFRHLFRHVYGGELVWERFQERLTRMLSVHKKLGQRLDEFDEFLQALEEEFERES